MFSMKAFKKLGSKIKNKVKDMKEKVLGNDEEDVQREEF